MSYINEQAKLIEELNKHNPTIKDTLFTGCDIICLNPKKYYAFGKSLYKFWKDYNNAAICLSNSHLGFAENFQFPPIMFHFNFFIDEIVHKTPILPNKFIEEMVELAQNVINSKITIDSNEQLICYVLKSNDIIIDGMTNIHLQIRFPYLHMNNHEQKTLAMSFKQSVISHQVLYGVGLQFVKPYESLLLDYSANNPPLYGSGDDLRPRLYFIDAYGYSERAPLKLNIFQAFDVRKHYHIMKNNFRDSYFKCQTQDDYERLIPFFMSLFYGYDGTDKTIISDRMDESILDDNESEISPSEPNYFREIFKSESRIEFPNRNHVDWLLESINPDRLKNEDRLSERLIIGRALYNTYAGSREGFEKWLSVLDDDIDKNEYKELYYSFNSGHNYTSKTLLYLAKEDNADDFQQWHFKQCEEIYENCLYDLTDANVALALYRTFVGYIFYMSDLKEWYQYDREQNRLIRCDTEMLFQTINYKFCLVFENLARIYDYKLKTIPNMPSDEKEILTDRKKRCATLINKLRGVRFKNCILTEAKSLFAIHDGVKVLNTDPNLLCVRNGVFDFYQDRIFYRDGIPEDFISKSTRVSYDPEAITSKMRDYLLNDVLKKIYPDPDILEFIINFDAISLRGGNKEKLIMFLISPGNTGKSTMVMLREAMFGDYSNRYDYYDLSVNKRTRGGPDPVRVDAATCRQVYFQETGRDVISANIFKTESGNEPYRARKLHQDGGVLTPQYRLIGSTNFPPVFDIVDDAIINRCIYIPHWSTFRNDAPDNEELQWSRRIFKPDISLQYKLGVLAKTYLCILFERYSYAAHKGLINLIPQSIKKFTRQFFSGEDKMMSFLDECVVHLEENSGVSLKTTEIYDRYRAWMRSKRDEPESLTTFTLNIKNYLSYVPRGNIRYDVDSDSWINVSLKNNQYRDFNFAV